MKTFLALTALSAGLFAGSASAAIVYTGWQSQDTTLQLITGVPILAFNQYDPSAHGDALLDNVEIKLSATGYSTYNVTAPVTFQFTNAMTVNLVAGTLGALTQASPSISDEPRTGPYSSPGFAVNPATFNIATPGMLSATANNGLNGVVFEGMSLTSAMATYFSGTGTAAISTNATSSPSFNATIEPAPSTRVRYDATVQVRYSYDNGVTPPPSQTPEPATLGLIGLGLAGLGFCKKKYA